MVAKEKLTESAKKLAARIVESESEIVKGNEVGADLNVKSKVGENQAEDFTFENDAFRARL